MKLAYTVSKEPNSGLWYAHMSGFPNIPVMSARGTFGTKKRALQTAADSMGLTYKEYMEIRKRAKV